MHQPKQPDDFPLATRTPNQFLPEQRDQIYAKIHTLDYKTFSRDGLQLVWDSEDVDHCLNTLDPGNSLDPLGGYFRLLRHVNPIFQFGTGLIPLPAAATANLTDPTLHKKVWDNLAGKADQEKAVKNGFMRIDRHNRSEAEARMRHHFDVAFANLGLGDQPPPGNEIDITGKLAPYFTARLICDCSSTPMEKADNLQLWSRGQSGLLGQNFTWGDRREQAVAVGHLNALFADTKASVKQDLQNQGKCDPEDPDYTLGLRLLDAGLPPDIVVSVIANSKAAGVFTMAYSIGNAVYRVAAQPEIFTNMNNEARLPQLLGNRALLIDPGLSAWRRQVTLKSGVKLPSGTLLRKGGVLALTAAANHDPKRYAHQGNILIGSPSGLEFGPKKSEHRCPGEDIARLAQGIFLQELRSRISNIELQKPGTNYPRRPDLLFTGTDTRLKVLG